MSKDYICIPPGETIQEIVENKPERLPGLIKELNKNNINYNELIKGKVRINIRVANILNKHLNVPIAFLMKLEKIYRNELKAASIDDIKNKGTKADMIIIDEAKRKE